MKVSNLIADIEYIVPEGTLKQYKYGVGYQGLDKIADKLSDLADIREKLDGKFPTGSLTQPTVQEQFHKDLERDKSTRGKEIELPVVESVG